MRAAPLLLGLVGCVSALDPAPGLYRTKSWARQLDCERMGPAAGSQRYPGEIAPPPPRGSLVEPSAMVCRERIADPDLRAAHDEAILSRLEELTTGLAEEAASLRPDLAERTWLVEAFDPSGPVAAKIAFASKNALMRVGLSVSDRTPVLSAGDVGVLTRMPPDQAYPAACLRWFETGGLREGDALLAVLGRDPRETTLHAGLCDAGRWTWIR